MGKETIGQALQSSIQNATIVFPEFLVSACITVLHESDVILSEDFGEIYNKNGEKVHEERAVNQPTYYDIQRLLLGYDFFKSSVLVAKVGNFLSWLMNQEATYEDEELWYMPEHMVELYNQFVLEQ